MIYDPTIGEKKFLWTSNSTNQYLNQIIRSKYITLCLRCSHKFINNQSFTYRRAAWIKKDGNFGYIFFILYGVTIKFLQFYIHSSPILHLHLDFFHFLPINKSYSRNNLTNTLFSVLTLLITPNVVTCFCTGSRQTPWRDSWLHRH
jgi:hypothetical protein